MTDTIVITDVDGGSITLSATAGARRIGMVPSGLLGDLRALVDMTLKECRGHRTATLVIPSMPTPRNLTAGWQHVAGALPGLPSWEVRGLDADSGWYQLIRPNDYGPADGPLTIHLCVLDRIDHGQSTLFAPGWDSAVIAFLLRRYRDLTGVPYFATPGLSGVMLLRERYRIEARRGPRPRWVAPDTAAEPPAPGWDLRYRRPGLDAPIPFTTCRFDVRAQYLAAAAVAQLPADPIVATGGIPFDRTRAGWWEIPVAQARVALRDLEGQCGCGDGDGIVPLWNPKIETSGDDGAWVWLSTPTVAFLADRYAPQVRPADVFTVRDSRTMAPAGRFLRPWAETIRDARYAVDGASDGGLWAVDLGVPGGEALTRFPHHLTRAIKQTANHGIGLLGRRGGTVYRPDWRALVIDTARVNLYRKLAAVRTELGVWPVKIDVDSVWYSINELGAHGDRLAEILGAGSPFIGKFRFEGNQAAGTVDVPRARRGARLAQ